MYEANEVFDDIENMKLNAAKGSPEDFDFFVTTGDNLYIPHHKGVNNPNDS